MGNELEKQYNIKTKPLKLPGAYNFLRFTYHPTSPQSIFIIKSPHKATIMQSSTLILPIHQIKNFSSSNDSFALCPKCVPLALLKPKSQTQMKILMYKILKTGSQIGRCFLAQGRIMVWCQQKRSLASMAPQQIQHGKYTQKSKVFTSGITLLNFLSSVHDQKLLNNKKDDKKKKSGDSKVPKTSNSSNSNQNKTYQLDQYTAEILPQQIKLFFDPKDQKQYFQLLEALPLRLKHTKFWQSISQGLRQLILNMLSIDSSLRVDLDTILKIPYFQSSIQIKLYFLLADTIQTMQRKQAIAFMKSLQFIIKQGTIFQPQILEEYIVPILISMSTNVNPKQANNFSAQAVSILIEVNKPPLDIIFMAFRKAPASDKNMVKLALEKKQKLYYLFDQQRFDSIISRMLFCSYQCDELINIAVMSTPFIMSCLKQEKYKKQIQFKLVSRILNLQFDKQKDKNNQELFINGLKCAIELIKREWVTNIKSLCEVNFSPLKLSLQANIHVLYYYRLLIEKLPTKQLWPIMMSKLQPYMSQPQISDQLFTTCHKLSKGILDRLYKQRKLNTQDDINLEYSEQYFKLKDQLSNDNKPLEQQVKKLKSHIEKNQFQQIGWIANQIF